MSRGSVATLGTLTGALVVAVAVCVGGGWPGNTESATTSSSKVIEYRSAPITQPPTIVVSDDPRGDLDGCPSRLDAIIDPGTDITSASHYVIGDTQYIDIVLAADHGWNADATRAWSMVMEVNGIGIKARIPPGTTLQPGDPIETTPQLGDSSKWAVTYAGTNMIRLALPASVISQQAKVWTQRTLGVGPDGITPVEHCDFLAAHLIPA